MKLLYIKREFINYINYSQIALIIEPAINIQINMIGIA